MFYNIYTSKVYKNDVITATGTIFTQDAQVSIFYVFIDADGNQSFSNSQIIFPSDIPQSFTLKKSISVDVNKIHLRFWVKGQLRSQVYVDDMKIVTEKKKKHIGVLGSCAVNNPFNSITHRDYKKNYVHELKDYGHSLISLMQPKNIVKKQSIFIPRELDPNRFHTVCLVSDFNKRFIDNFKIKSIDYLILDVYPDVDKGVLMYNKDKIITDTKGFEHTKLFKSIKNVTHLNLFNDSKKYFDLWKKSCDEFFSFLELYSPKTKVVLSEFRVIDNVQSEDGKIFKDKLLSKKAEKYNPLIKKLEDYIKDNYNVLVLNFDEKAIYKENDDDVLIFNEDYYSNYLDKLDDLIKNN